MIRREAKGTLRLVSTRREETLGGTTLGTGSRTTARLGFVMGLGMGHGTQLGWAGHSNTAIAAGVMAATTGCGIGAAVAGAGGGEWAADSGRP